MATEGHCLCGAVRIRAEHLASEMSACHCGMCRRWSGSVQMGIDARGVTVEGPVRLYASTPFSERAWCDTCGSALWLKDTDSEVFELVPGLFEKAGGARLVREVYADRAPDGYAFAGEIRRVSKADYEAENRHVDGGGRK